MSNKVLLKRSSVSGRAPAVTDLEFGEVALNYADGKLYFKRSDGTTIDFFQSQEVNTILNDISSQFDGVKGSFTLMLEQSAVTTITDSKNLEVVISGKKLSPYVTTLSYPWLVPFDTIKGYRVRDGKLIIYNPPDVGETSLLTYKTPGTSTTQTKRYPFSATTIALGD